MRTVPLLIISLGFAASLILLTFLALGFRFAFGTLALRFVVGDPRLILVVRLESPNRTKNRTGTEGKGIESSDGHLCWEKVGGSPLRCPPQTCQATEQRLYALPFLIKPFIT